MGLNEGKPTLWINNKYVFLLQIRNEMGRRRAAALQLIRFKFRGKIISCSPLLIGQPYAPPILYNMDSEGEDNATHGIGNGIKHIRIPSRHKILVDLIRDPVEKGNEKRDKNRLVIFSGQNISGRQATHFQVNEPVCQQRRKKEVPWAGEMKRRGRSGSYRVMTLSSKY